MIKKIFNFILNINIGISNFLEKTFPAFFRGNEAIKKDLYERINNEIKIHQPKQILEAGGIDRPILPKHKNYKIDGLDVDYSQKCEEIYDNFFVQSIEEPLKENYDLIFSKTLLEHVPNNTLAYTSMFNSLNNNGAIIHHFPLKNHPYSLATRLVGNKLQRFLIKTLKIGQLGIIGYKTYFDLCSSYELNRALKKIGYEITHVKYYYHANGYFKFFFPFFILISIFEFLCKTFGFSFFASGILIEARKSKS